MAHVDAEKFYEVMTCFFIAAQCAGNSDAGSVFEKCMYAISCALPGPSAGGMHVPTVHLLQQQLSSPPTPPSPSSLSPAPFVSPFSPSACAGRDGAAAQPHAALRFERHAPTYATLERRKKVVPDSLAADGRSRAQEIPKITEAPSFQTRVIAPSNFPQYQGFPAKEVCGALQKQFPEMRIEVLQEGQKLIGVSNNRIVVIANRWGDVVAAPRMG